FRQRRVTFWPCRRVRLRVSRSTCTTSQTLGLTSQSFFISAGKEKFNIFLIGNLALSFNCLFQMLSISLVSGLLSFFHFSLRTFDFSHLCLLSIIFCLLELVHLLLQFFASITLRHKVLQDGLLRFF